MGKRIISNVVRCIIAGPKSVKIEYVDEATKQAEFDIDMVISGTSGGVDSIGEKWAKKRGLPYKSFEPDYNKLTGYEANIKRNEKLMKYANAVLAVWDGEDDRVDDIIHFAEQNNMKKSVYLFS